MPRLFPKKRFHFQTITTIQTVLETLSTLQPMRLKFLRELVLSAGMERIVSVSRVTEPVHIMGEWQDGYKNTMEKYLKKKPELEKRLKLAFPKEWKVLNDSQKDFILKKYYEKVWPVRVKPEETLTRIQNKGISYGLFLLGVPLAISAGLVVNIVHDAFKIYGQWYITAAAVTLFALVLAFERFLDKSLIEDYKEDGFLDELLDGYQEHSSIVDSKQ